MEIKEFIENVQNQFEDTDPSMITAETEFKMLDEWSSLMALSLIGMVDEEYDILLKGDDIKGANTVADLFNIVKARV